MIYSSYVPALLNECLLLFFLLKMAMVLLMSWISVCFALDL